MPWYKLIPESWKKRACRYLLQRYVGHFLKEKLSLDQLSVDLYSGKGVIKELNLDVEALNDALETFNIPLEIVDGFIGSISVSIPWTSLLNESTTVEVSGLELTITPKQWDDSGETLDTLSMLNSMHMASSMQLAQEVLKSEKAQEDLSDEPSGFEGVQMFAQTIDTVLSRIKMTFVDTTIRLEHLPKAADKGVALELKIERMEYFDDIAVEPEGSPVDSPPGSFQEPSGIALKNVHIMGVTLFFDEFFRDPGLQSFMESPELSPRLYDSAITSLYKSTNENPISQSITSQPRSLGVSLANTSQPILIAIFSGKQELKAKLKQLDTLPGPKLELDCQLGAFHLLLSPRQLHGILEIFSGLTSPASSDEGNGRKRSSKDKPMKASDYKRVESELQRHLQSGRLEQHVSHMSPQTGLYMQDDLMMESIVDELNQDDLYFSMHGRDTSQSEMESSFSSNYSGTTNRTTSTATSFPKSESTGYPRQHSSSLPKSPKDHIQKLLDDPSAELSRYRLKLSFISVNILHENPTSTPGDQLTPEVPASEKLKTVSETYFSKAKMIAFSGMTSTLKDLREKFSEALPYDHIGLLGKPLTLECAQKTSQYTQSLTLDLTVGMFEAIECLFDRRNFTASMMGFSLPVENKLPEYSELLVFDSKDAGTTHPANVMYSSMHGAAAPALKLNFLTADRLKSSSKTRKLPNTKVSFELGKFRSEVDITIVDRINSLLSPEPVLSPEHGGSVRYKAQQHQQTSVLGRQCFSQAMDEGSMTEQKPIDLHIASTDCTLVVRFPIIDMRSGPQVMKRPWWQRNLHKEQLILEMKNFTFNSEQGNGGPQQKMEFMCSDISGYFKEDQTHDKIHLVSISADDSCDGADKGFNWPRVVITTSEKMPSVLEEEQGDSEDSLPMDSLNGVCQFDHVDPSPFSAHKSMYEQEDLSLGDKAESKHTSEEMVLPGDKEEMREFQYHCNNNTKLLVDVTLPIVTAKLPSKALFEVLYNRVNNDLTLWEPSAPSPLRPKESMSLVHPPNLDIVHMYHQERFSMTQSAIQYDSGSDSDSDDYHYSIHDRGSRHQVSPKQRLPSKFCFSLNISKGKLLMVTPHKDETKHGELCVELDDATLFSVVSYNGDPDLRYVCFQANKVAMCNNGSMAGPASHTTLDMMKRDMLQNLEPRIYKSERGVASKSATCVGRGGDSPDMISLAIKIKLDTINNTKEFVVSVGLRGGTLRHKMVASGESWISQCMDFLDVKDYPILGYTEPKVITELHVHLWSCAVDYRPVHIRQRAMLTAETFSISSNIVAQSPTTLLRFHLDDAALFLSDKEYMEAHLKRDYVCVADVENFELSLRTSDGKDQKFPKTDLRISTNRLNIRTCADSCRALTELIRYFADDGDLLPTEDQPDDARMPASSPPPKSPQMPDTCMQQESHQMSESRLEQVHSMMEDAMQESEGSSSSSESPDRQLADNKTQVFFLPNTQGQGQSHIPPGGLRPIVISNSADSVTSSTLSDRTEKLSDEEEFCIIDDPGWGIAPRDGEPVIRVLTKKPIVIKENFFAPPLGKADQLKPPEHFPAAEYRYTLKELTVVWYMYGGQDFSGERIEPASATPSPKRPRLPGHDPGLHHKQKQVKHHNTWQSRGGPHRDLNTLMELQLTKVRCQHEVYPTSAKQASRQVLIISEFEVRDRLSSSQINKFLYQYTSENMPKQTHANMLLLKALHTRPDSSPSQECALRVSLLPLRLNIDQDALFFLRRFFMDLSGADAPDPVTGPAVPIPETPVGSPKPPGASLSSSPAPPAPVMAVNLSPDEDPEGDQQDLLIMFDEMNLDGESEAVIQQKMSESSTSSIGSDHAAQPVFFKSFIFSPDVPIRLDYHGKRVDMEQGTFAGLLVGLAHLNCSELKLKRLNYKHGLLGMDKLAKYAVSEWLNDIKKTQLPSILGGVGPMYSFVQIVHGVRDLFYLPVEQYRKDGRIVRGLQRGASSFTTSTAMALLELTNKVVQSIQYVAELTYDMLSPGPSVRKMSVRQAKLHHRRGQPSDVREGMTNAYIVIREGFTNTANNLVRAATEEQEQKGIIGVAGGVLRQIPPTIVQPVIIATEATSKVLGGMRNQLRPEAKKEDEDKWREDEKS